MTSPGFLVAILELDTYPSQYGSSRTTHLSSVYLETASRYSLDLSFVSFLISAKAENEKLETSKILDVRRVQRTWELFSPSTRPGLFLVSIFLPVPSYSILIHSELSCSQFVQSFPKSDIENKRKKWEKEKEERSKREETRIVRIKKARDGWANSSNHASRCLVINRAHENELLRHQRPSRSSQRLHITEKSLSAVES